jgi:acyl-CoA synthetase (AMP-forming)/AMP-acid ligase II
MTSILELLNTREVDFTKPFFINDEITLCLNDVINRNIDHLGNIEGGDVVALIGDFNANTISDLLHLIERKVILVPLTGETVSDHQYFFDSAHVEWVVQNGAARKIGVKKQDHLLNEVRRRESPGLILFSTGTTGRPKAILHDFSFFLLRYLTPRPSLTTLNFLLFDHIGGINTLLHSMFNSGLIVSIKKRTVMDVLKTCEVFKVEVLPTTPTFLRMMLISGLVSENFPKTLKIITYGTERMDEFTLLKLAELLPNVDFRQTFGMSELGILRVKSESRTSLFMKIGGEGVTWKIVDNVLKINSPNRMLGYLNADSPFDQDGWYDTKDLVEVKGDLIRVVGRTSNIVNVAGLKFLTSEIESVGLAYPGICDLSILVKSNPITGQHIEMVIKTVSKTSFILEDFKQFLSERLPKHMVPKRITLGEIGINHRFKKN